MINTRNMTCMAAAAFLGALLVGAAAMPAHGQSMAEPVMVTAKAADTLTRTVAYGDLSLASKAGRNVLYHRVGAAVRDVCPSVDRDYTPLDAGACEMLAWQDARPQIERAFEAARTSSPAVAAIEITSSLGR